MMMIDCETVMRELWAYLDDELTPARVAQIESHISMCQRCYPQVQFERAFLEQIARTRREHSDLEGLRARLLTVLRAEGFAAR